MTRDSFFPSGPEANRYDPKQLVERPNSRPRMFAFEHGKLLAQGEVLQHEAAPGPESSWKEEKQEPEKLAHGDKVIAVSDSCCYSKVVDFEGGRSW